MFINTVIPEAAAEFLRNVKVENATGDEVSALRDSGLELANCAGK